MPWRLADLGLNLEGALPLGPGAGGKGCEAGQRVQVLGCELTEGVTVRSISEVL